MSTTTDVLMNLKPPSGRSTGRGVASRAAVVFPVVFRLIETTSNVGPAGAGGAVVWVKTWDVSAANSNGNAAILVSLAIRMVALYR